MGNSLEVMEAIHTLKGQGPKDITELSLELSSIMIYLGGRSKSLDEGRKMAAKSIADGRALEKFRQFISAQSGNPDVTNDESLFPQAEHEISMHECSLNPLKRQGQRQRP